jgi:hypothetical protein
LTVNYFMRFDQKFHLTNSEIRGVKQINNELLTYLHAEMTTQGFSGQYRYRGSSYEGTKIKDSRGQELDVARIQYLKNCCIKVRPLCIMFFFRLLNHLVRSVISKTFNLPHDKCFLLPI